MHKWQLDTKCIILPAGESQADEADCYNQQAQPTQLNIAARKLFSWENFDKTGVFVKV